VRERTSRSVRCRPAGIACARTHRDQEDLSGRNIDCETIDQEAIENLRAFFSILQEWDEDDRREADRISQLRRERAARTIAEHFREDVESE